MMLSPAATPLAAVMPPSRVAGFETRLRKQVLRTSTHCHERPNGRSITVGLSPLLYFMLMVTVSAYSSLKVYI